MTPRVAIVTDSTATLPSDGAEQVASSGLTVVPLQVVMDGRSLADGVEAGSGDVARVLSAGRPVTTSRPAPALFTDTYRRLAAGGCAGIVSVHLSADLSGTVDAARQAARGLAGEIDVQVVDSRSLAMGLGHAVVAAVRSAQSGATVAEVARAATRRAMQSQAWVYVDTLEYLHRGGRIGAAAAFLGSALAVKPLLQLVDGRLEAVDKVRTSARALTRLEEIVVAAARSTGQPVWVAVHHLAAGDRAEQMAHRLRAALPDARGVDVVEVGAVIGAHVGPGTIAVLIVPAAAGVSGGA
jgi:DegV family protein with EDD domain